MIVKNPDNYRLLKFRISKSNNKKYDAILINKHTNNIKIIPFGDIRYEQFYDKLGKYSYLNHNNKDRQKKYIERHQNDIDNKFSSGWFAYHYLWS